MKEFLEFCSKYQSISQNNQDLWILFETNLKRDGYFVDFGATDGKTINNTYILEKEYGWNGIVSEPNKVWHDQLYKNRSCYITTDCVYTESNTTVEFINAEAPDLSTIKGFGTDDEHKHKRSSDKCETSLVNTITLYDLLKKYDAPEHIDYLSIDTEGSEYDILYHFLKTNNDHYKIKYITVEHNYVPVIRKKLYALLVSNGYQRKFDALSRCDDFYVRVK